MRVRVSAGLCVWLYLRLCLHVEGNEFGSRWFCAGGGSGEDENSSSASGSVESVGVGVGGIAERKGAPCSCSSLPDPALNAKRMNCHGRGFESLDSAIKLPIYVADLDLSGNPIHFFDKRFFGENQQLRTLTLSNTLLIKVSSDALAGFPNLTTLDLSDNRLETLPDDLLQYQTHLKVLDLSSNLIKSLPISIFQTVTNLDTLSLSGNLEIGRYMHGSAEALLGVLKSGLRHLKIDRVGLSHIPEHFFSNEYHLKELQISNNLFTTLPQLDLAYLQVLNISGAIISTIGTSNFQTLSNLRRVYMDNMPRLNTIEEGAFVGLTFLEVLSLEKCQNLTFFNAMAFGQPDTTMPSLKQLSLARGGLQTLSSRLLTIFKNVTDLRLYGNPWTCDCKLSWFKKLNLSKENEKQLRCFSPRSLHDKPWSTLEESNFVCVDNKARLLYGFMVTLAVIFSLVIVATLFAIGCTLRRKFKRYGMIRRDTPMPYEPMLVRLHSSAEDPYWEDTDSVDSHRPISFIRHGQIL